VVGSGIADRAARPFASGLPVDHIDLGKRTVGVAAQAQHEAGQAVVADVLLALAGRQFGADDEVLRKQRHFFRKSLAVRGIEEGIDFAYGSIPGYPR
jgi:hypothetical protein